jgi:hypothetical protein
MPVIKQKIKGRSVNTLVTEATSADLTDLLTLLEGEVTEYDLKASGGSVAPYPLALNTKKFSCGNKTSKISSSFSVKHLKPTVFINDVEAVVIGAFDASYDSTIKADYTNLLYDRN